MSDTALKAASEPPRGAAPAIDIDRQSVLLSKRRVSFTAKGMMFFIQTCQEKRAMKCKQAKMYMNQLNDLMQSTENVNAVNSILNKLITCFEEATQMHESFLSLDLPKDEVEKQIKYFEQKVASFSNFIEEVKSWLSNAGHLYEPSNDDKPAENENDDIRPEDSVSNVLGPKVSSKVGSGLSKISSTNSAKIKAQAEKAALAERMAALKRKHLLEAREEKIRLEQEQLRREKEQLALETEIKETNAKLEVFELSSKYGSRVSDGMNSYFEKAV